MAFANVLDGADSVAGNVQQFVDAFNGTNGEGQPLDMIALDADRYYVEIKNLHANSKGIRLFKADGTVLLQVDSDGVKGSINGSAAAVALAPSASPTLTGSPTLNGVITLSGRVLLGHAASTASASTLTLPATGGPVYPISGTTTITAITAVSKLWAILEFGSAGCQVTNGASLRLNGNYTSHGSSSCLSLICSETGGIWEEIGRG